LRPNTTPRPESTWSAKTSPKPDGIAVVPNEKTNTVKIKRPKGETRPQAASAYYFIDDVAVFPIKSPSECKCEQLDKAESEFIYGKKTTTTWDGEPLPVSKKDKDKKKLEQTVKLLKDALEKSELL
jgi:hypothetical protein